MLSLKLEPDNELSRDDIKKAKEIIRSILNLDIELKRFYSAVEGDRVMSTLTRQLRGLQSPATATVFEVLVDTITEQQISLKAAFALQRKLTRAFGDVLEINDKTYYAYPRPERLAETTIEQLMAYGLSTRKAEYIQGLAKRIVEGLDLERLKECASEVPPPEIPASFEVRETLDRGRVAVLPMGLKVRVLAGVRRGDKIVINLWNGKLLTSQALPGAPLDTPSEGRE